VRCPHCGASQSRVIDTTSDPNNEEIRRRRVCLGCDQRFSTVESVRAGLPLVVKDRVTGVPARREPFDAGKLHQSILIACAKRPIPTPAVDRLVAGIESHFRAENIAEVSSREIGQMVIDGLHALDEIAYIRYAIVFLELDDLAAVRDEIDRVLNRIN
jgi:transcriptional repressor NrdR